MKNTFFTRRFVFHTKSPNFKSMEVIMKKKLVTLLLAASLFGTNLSIMDISAAELTSMKQMKEEKNNKIEDELTKESLELRSNTRTTQIDSEAGFEVQSSPEQTKETVGKAALTASNNSNVSKNALSDSSSVSSESVKLLSTLIYCEAGAESYNGKLAVGIVVMNRIRSSKFPNSLNGVVYQSSQFGPVRNGSLRRALASYQSGSFNSASQKQCIKAAKEALNGTRVLTINGTQKDFSKYLYFNGVRPSGSYYKLGTHYFR